MIRKDFPKLGEHYFEERLPNGLLVRVMEKPGFAKRYAAAGAGKMTGMAQIYESRRAGVKLYLKTEIKKADNIDF